MYYGDLAGNGSVEMVEAFFDHKRGRIVPWRDLDAVAKPLPWVRERFPTSQAYGEASLEEILGQRLKVCKEVRVNWLDTTVFLNRGDHFEIKALPLEAQFAPAFGVCVGDLDGDGQEDIFLSQNFFAVEERTTRYDGGRGLWLRGEGRGEFAAISGQQSGLKIYGEQRGSALCDYDGDGRVDLAVGQNATGTKLYHNEAAKPGLRVRLKGPPGNTAGIGAVVRIVYGERLGPAREVHAGSGYWSQDSAVQVFGNAAIATQVQVQWPGGKTVRGAISKNAREISVDAAGKVEVIR